MLATLKHGQAQGLGLMEKEKLQDRFGFIKVDEKPISD